MVVALNLIRNSKQMSPLRAPQAPAMHYSREETLTGVVGVKSKVVGVRRRLVRLEAGILSIHADGDDCGEPLFTTRVNEAAAIVTNASRCTITMRTNARLGVTLVFKHDASLMQLWATALRKAHDNRVTNYYKVCAQIGRGHYARVYEGFDRRTGDKVAIKVMPKNNADAKLLQYIKREAEIVRMVNHPNVVKTLDVFETDDHLTIVMEYVSSGNLLEFLASGKNRVNEKNALRIAKQLLHAIAYLHGKDIIHRDIKAENILITPDGTIKVADFGLARQLDGVGSDEYCLSSILGTPAYCSPEVVTRSHYGKPVDLFGCGVLLYIALSGALPFRGDTADEVFDSIANGRLNFPAARWALVSEDARDFVEGLLSHCPSDRPSATEALMHPWLQLSGDRQSYERPISPVPFVRNASARSPRKTNSGRKPNSAQFPIISAKNSFRRAQSGSLKQLTLEKMRQRCGAAY